MSAVEESEGWRRGRSRRLAAIINGAVRGNMKEPCMAVSHVSRVVQEAGTASAMALGWGLTCRVPETDLGVERIARRLV